MKIVPLGSGALTIVDDEDFDLVMKFNWSVIAPSKRGNKYYVGGMVEGAHFYLHRFLLSPPADMDVDHINGLTFDNRRSNLRACTSSENACNARQKTHYRKSGGFIRYKGVHPVSVRKNGKEPKNPFYAAITKHGRYVHIGVYKTQEDAARAYDEAARQYHGPFARLNFPNDQSAVPPEVFFKPQESSECRTNGSVPETLESAA